MLPAGRDATPEAASGGPHLQSCVRFAGCVVRCNFVQSLTQLLSMEERRCYSTDSTREREAPPEVAKMATCRLCMENPETLSCAVKTAQHDTTTTTTNPLIWVHSLELWNLLLIS